MSSVDESTDRTDVAQLRGDFRENCIFFSDNNLDMKRVCMLVTDGAPSMAGKKSGLAAGRDKTVIDLAEQMRAFPVKMDLFATDLTGRMLHFPTLREHIASPAQITDVMRDFIAKLKENFAGRLDGLTLPTEIMAFARDPFTTEKEGDLSARAKQAVPSIDEGKFILQLVDMQSSATMAVALRNDGPAKFWSDVNTHQFPNVKKVAVFVLSMFGSTYTCELSFSHLNAIKNSYRCSLTDNKIHQCLRIALTSYEPNKKCHLSH
ncbi:Uncharacterized protein FKW44_002793 [Caligus rogercresseyi]|uniref:HAT C-terminal dimerisation domain-containing protein n=1 Tax=Caligus rogercresseyi TaxID=217165 RepID=A0A7T8KL35_CALRO|nr:Uncharacterized protein FKW44_002793 [Caligus rogercresseyi]